MEFFFFSLFSFSSCWFSMAWYDKVLIALEQKKEDARLKKEREQLKYQKEHAYDFLNNEEEMEATSNQNRDEGWEDDFM